MAEENLPDGNNIGRYFKFIHIHFLPDYTSLIPQNAFPTRDALIYASRLIGEGRLGTESIEGLEQARETYQKEIEARNKFSRSEFCQQRISNLNIDTVIATDEIQELQKQGYALDSPKLKAAIVRNDTYTSALYPDYAIRYIEEAIRYKKGGDFNDSGNNLGLGPDIPSDFPDIER